MTLCGRNITLFLCGVVIFPFCQQRDGTDASSDFYKYDYCVLFIIGAIDQRRNHSSSALGENISVTFSGRFVFFPKE